MRGCNKRTKGGLPWLSIILRVKAGVLQELVERVVYVIEVEVEVHAVKEVVAVGEIGKNRLPLLQCNRNRYSQPSSIVRTYSVIHTCVYQFGPNEQGCIQDRQDNSYRYIVIYSGYAIRELAEMIRVDLSAVPFSATARVEEPVFKLILI